MLQSQAKDISTVNIVVLLEDLGLNMHLVCTCSSQLRSTSEGRICRQEVKAYEKKIENWSMPLKSEPKLAAAPTVKVTIFYTSPFDVYSGFDVLNY